MSNITEEIKKRRTFAIISHPDAGKTTLTEKFLLYGGAGDIRFLTKNLSGLCVHPQIRLAVSAVL